jgi:hypothetical protein
MLVVPTAVSIETRVTKYGASKPTIVFLLVLKTKRHIIEELGTRQCMNQNGSVQYY